MIQEIGPFDKLNLRACWITIGSFDGVHRGHQYLLSSLAEAAHLAGYPALVITFFPHPLEVLKGFSKGLYLSYPQEREALILRTGIDHVITVPFTHHFAGITAEDFLKTISASIGVKQIWTGPDFALGHGREGTLDKLIEYGRKYGFEVKVNPPLADENDVKISSTTIRKLLSEGAVKDAADLLGRHYSVEGLISHGKGRGKNLGFPTANIDVPTQRVLPKNGVYTSRFYYNGEKYKSITNVGVNPTFKNDLLTPRIETMIFDFNQDIYGKTAKVEFVNFLRDEKRFDSVEELQRTVAENIIAAREEPEDG